MDKIMYPRMTNILLLALFFSIIIGIVSAANASTGNHTVEMLNKSGNEKFVYGQEVEPIGGFASEVISVTVLQGGTLLTIFAFCNIKRHIIFLVALSRFPSVHLR